MGSLDSLPADQRAVLQLVLTRGRTYDEIAALLSIDRAAVRRRALEGFDALGPSNSISPLQRALVTDYLLGQLPAQVAGQVYDRLGSSPPDRAWARVIASEIAGLSDRPLPEIPSGSARRREPPVAAANGADAAARATDTEPSGLESGGVVPAPFEPPPFEPPPFDPRLLELPGGADADTTDADEADTGAIEAVPADAPPVPFPDRPVRRLREVPVDPDAAEPAPARSRRPRDASRGETSAGRSGRPPRSPQPPLLGEPARSSRRGGAMLLALLALLVVVVVVVIVALVGGGGGKKQPAAANTPTASTPATGATAAGTTSTPTTATTGTTSTTGTTTTKAQVLAQINLTSPTSAKNTAGVAQVIKDGTTLGIVLVAQGLPANSTTNAYAVWLYNSPTSAYRIGFVGTRVTSNGRLETDGPLPASAGSYKELLVTLETQTDPKTPGPIVLQGAFTVG